MKGTSILERQEVMKAIVECTKGTIEKYELAQDGSFVFDRKLKRKWVASYGFIPGTLQADGDELDCYILGKAKQGQVVEVMPICMIYCIDNMQIDNKLICAAKTAGGSIKHQVSKVAHFVAKYKKGCMVAGVSWNSNVVRYEIAKCKAYCKLFRGGKQCQY